MMVLTANITQKNNLAGIYLHGNQLGFIEDANGNWVVNQEVLTDPDFVAVHEQLAALSVIEYVAKPSPPLT